MVYSRSHHLILLLLICNVFLGYKNVHLVIAQNENDYDVSCTDGDDICQGGGRENEQQQQQKPLKESKLCSSSTNLSTLDHFYFDQGISAQTYKPNTPIKSTVCEADGSDDIHSIYNVAHWSFWRSSSYTIIPKLVVTANIYSCGDPSISSVSFSASNEEGDDDDVIVIEVWQPRPDGTYSSLRPGIEEGVCRASVPIQQNNNNNEFSNILGNVHFSTLAPGSPGLLNGLIPHGSRDYPPYSKGNIQMYLNVDGYYPWLGQFSMNELDDILKNRSLVGRRFHDAKNKDKSSSSGNGGGGGIEIKSVTQVSASLMQVEIDIFIEQRKPEENNSGVVKIQVIYFVHHEDSSIG